MKRYVATTRIKHGLKDGEVKYFEPGDPVEGLSKAEMITLWEAGSLREEDTGLLSNGVIDSQHVGVELGDRKGPDFKPMTPEEFEKAKAQAAGEEVDQDKLNEAAQKRAQETAAQQADDKK